MRTADRVYQQLKQTDPKAAEEFRARMEKLEKDTGERLKADEAKTLTQQGQMLAKGRESLVPLKHRIQVLQDELASLAPAGRAAPASYLRGSKRPSGLVDAGTAGARAVVAINPAFFSARLPKTSVQLIAVSEYPTKSLLFRRGDYADASYVAVVREKLARS